MRVIPRRTKVKMEFFKNVTLGDIILAFIGVAVGLGLFLSGFPNNLGIWLGLAWVAIVISLYFKVADDTRLYQTLGYAIRFLAQKKRYAKEKIKKFSPVSEIIPFVDIYQDRFIDFKEYFGMVVEVYPLEFGLLNDYKQEMVIETFANALRRLSDEQSASIVKVNKAMILDSYIYNEDKKYDNLLELQYEGEISPEEVEVRAGVFEERVSRMESMNRDEKIFKDHFYIVVYDKDKELLENTINGIMSTLQNSPTPMHTERIVGNDLAVFLRANFGKEFDERELESLPFSKHVDWATPNKIRFQASRVIIDDKPYRQFVVSDYPLQVPNAWGYPFYRLDRTRVITKIKPVQKFKAERAIDKAIMEMETKVAKVARSSRQIENQTHLQTLRELLAGLKNNNQQLYDVNIFITCEEPARKEVRAILKQQGFKYSEMFGRQVDAFISSNISMRDNVENSKRGIPTTTLASIFPFVSSALQDPNGFYIGYNEFPVFIDFFKRDRERVNSNMMIIGKSGSGKSYCTKTLLANFAADNTKVFILDPEDEYTQLSKNLRGKWIDVGSSAMGIINPFHIITSLEADEGGDDDSYSIHLQFLEQFFKVIMEGMNSESFEILNSAVVEVYKEKGIGPGVELSKLKPEDFPIFEDTAKTEYERKNYMTVETYVKKFASGGRNSNLWNGPTTMETKENFVTFNFRSLLANRNQVIANAQMLLVFKYLDNEIIKNKDFNERFNIQRKIVVAVDEAHVFINPNYPQMAKRIRKYSGMQIVITQNIKDFVGSQEIQRQSTAVINASQYSFIFSLSPNDMNDLVELYRKSGEINEEEQNSIVTAGVGQAFVITGPMSRTMVQVVAYDYVKRIFSQD